MGKVSDIGDNPIAKSLRELRKNNGDRQEDLARKIGVDRKTVGYNEKASTWADSRYILSICNVYKVSPNLIFGFSNNISELLDHEVASFYKKLDHSERKFFYLAGRGIVREIENSRTSSLIGTPFD